SRLPWSVVRTLRPGAGDTPDVPASSAVRRHRAPLPTATICDGSACPQPPSATGHHAHSHHLRRVGVRRSEVERARVGRYVDGVLLEGRERHDREDRLVGGREYGGGSDAVAVGAGPVDGGDAPAVAGTQSGEAVVRAGRHEVVADAALVVEELVCQHGADRVAAQVLRAGVAAAVTVEPGHRVGTTGLELPAEDVAFGHGPSMPRPGTPVGTRAGPPMSRAHS